jgi:spore maturation protein CgeB
MRVAMFCHSLVSDWNHGNAHFLRGVASELVRRGHAVDVYEPENAWSKQNLIKDAGREPIDEFTEYYPQLVTKEYTPKTIDLDHLLATADLVIVHEWNDHDLVACIGEHHRTHDYKLLFHDTHHRAISDRTGIEAYDLSEYDGVLAFGDVIRKFYLENHQIPRAWTWHEAADTNVFFPHPRTNEVGDLVWIGNWGDDERTAELHEFLLEPVKELGLRAAVYGVRYPKEALRALERAGIEYRGWLPNYRVPEVFAQFKVTVHVPRRPYVEQLPGIPTIRPFEAMACGIPLVSSPWDDTEGLFTAGQDYLVANDRSDMVQHVKRMLSEPREAAAMAERARNTILKKHTCAQRVDELLAIYGELSARELTQSATL